MKSKLLNPDGLMFLSFWCFILTVCSTMLILIGLPTMGIAFAFLYFVIGLVCLAFSFILIN